MMTCCKIVRYVSFPEGSAGMLDFLFGKLIFLDITQRLMSPVYIRKIPIAAGIICLPPKKSFETFII